MCVHVMGGYVCVCACDGWVCACEGVGLCM